MTTLQELLDAPAARVVPSPKDGEEKERHRLMIPPSRIAWYEKEFKEITKHYDSSESIALERRLWDLWEKFKGNRRR